MSERPGEQGPPGSSNASGNDAGRPPLSSSISSHQYGSRGYQRVSATTVPDNARQPQSGIQLPPLSQATSVTSGNFAPRSTGLPSILNPPTSNDSSQSRRRKFDQLDSPPSSVTSLPPLVTGPYAGLRGSAYGTPTSVPGFITSGSQNRPAHSPRSPAPPTAGSRHTNPPTGTISARQTPFPVSPRTRSYTHEASASTGSSFLPPPGPGRQGYGFAAPVPAALPPPKTRRASLSRRSRRPSSTASLSPSYSEFSQAGEMSPALQYSHHTSSMPTLASAYSGQVASSSVSITASAPPHTSGPERQRPLGIPISSAAGQNVYQMMTLETTSGTVQLPVDVQAASRVADEKRRRNAGASARFRQRRKEKERESSTTISKLENKIKALNDDAEFYRRERDYFAGIILQVPGGERHFPRQQSPRHRRSSSILAPGSGSGSGGYLSGPEQMISHSPDQDRNVRRRTSTISLPPPPAPMAAVMSMGQPMTPSFVGQTYVGTPMAQQPPAYPSTLGPFPSPLSRVNLPGAGSLAAGLPSQPQHQHQHLQHPLPLPTAPQLMQAQPQPQTGPWNPYASDRRPPLPRSQSQDGRQ